MTQAGVTWSLHCYFPLKSTVNTVTFYIPHCVITVGKLLLTQFYAFVFLPEVKFFDFVLYLL